MFKEKTINFYVKKLGAVRPNNVNNKTI